MMKTGHVEKTIDRDYEIEERRFRTMESAANRLQKEAKGYLDSLRAMTASQTRIAETIDAFYGEAGTKDNISAYYRQAVEDLDAETVKELVISITCQTDPMTARSGTVSLTLYQGSALTFLISTKPSRSVHINFSIMTH
jgi:hypothetical protein